MNRKVIIQILIFLGAFTATDAMASDYYYCSKSGSYVNVGDTLAKVENLCGKPTQTAIVNLRNPHASTETTRWVYAQMTRVAGQRHSETLGSESFLIDFENGVVKDIMIHGNKVPSTNLCSHLKTIAVGDSISRVWSTCGSPRYKRLYHSKQKTSATPEQAVVYRYTSLGSTTTLIFRQFKLVEIKP
ncbi:MAG: DUF2845 domain-containing protein [Gammaproteobacteria bacterium]|nr:DUF2845 domain-containing protein [Gammaproteobacteria bacterium]